MIYLDNAATTLRKPNAVIKSVNYALKNLSSPGRGGYKNAMEAADVALGCREKASKLFNVSDPESVVFTFNATHGLNIAINSLVRKGMRVVVTGYEHNSVIRPLKAQDARIDVAKAELFEPEMALFSFEEKLLQHADVVVVNHVSNVFGFVQPLYEIARLCKEKEIPLIIDASQSAGTLEIDATELGAAFIAMPGHKGLYGPQGTGILICGTEARPILHGGSGSDSLSENMPMFLPDRLEAGTHNIPGIAGLSAGLDYVIKTGTKKILEHEKSLIKIFTDSLRGVSGVKAYCSEHMFDQTGVISFTVDGIDSETVGQRLSQMGIAVRAGLHCAPLAHKTAGTLQDGTVRASVSAFSTASEMLVLSDAVKKIARS